MWWSCLGNHTKQKYNFIIWKITIGSHIYMSNCTISRDLAELQAIYRILSILRQFSYL